MDAVPNRNSARELATRLEVLGLGDKEAAIYAHLAVHGGNRAGELASALHIHRSEAYRFLQKLERDGYVEPRPTNPVTYEAVPLPQVADRAAQRLAEQARDIKELAAEMAPLLAGRPSAASPVTARYLIGREAGAQAALRMIQRAERELCFFATRDDHPAFFRLPGVAEAGAAAFARGVRMRLLLRPSPQVQRGLNAVRLPEAAQMRWLGPQAPPNVFVVRDADEALLAVALQSPERPSDDDVWMLTDSPYIVATAKGLFERVWLEQAPRPSPGT